MNPNRLLKDFQALLRRAVGETVEIRFDLDAVLDPVRLDPGQFESAVLNLAVNARDAMPNGGVLTVKTCNGHLDAAEIPDRPDLQPGAYVLVSVTDTGQGSGGGHTQSRLRAVLLHEGRRQGDGAWPQSRSTASCGRPVATQSRASGPGHIRRTLPAALRREGRRSPARHTPCRCGGLRSFRVSVRGRRWRSGDGRTRGMA